MKPAPHGPDKPFSQRGGVRYGGRFWLLRTSVQWPLVKLTVDSNQMRFSGWWFNRIFPKEQLTRLSPVIRPFVTGFRIEHTIPEAPAFIIFWTFDYDTLATELRRLGYVVE